MRDFQLTGRSAVLAENGMCATSHPLAAQAAVDILKRGGNAVDAAIAGAVLLGLCEPPMTGLGGDCFVLLKPAGEDRVIALNGSGRAPAAATAARLRGMGHATVPLFSPEAVTIPGAVDAFCRLSADWGRLGLADSLAPAIHYFDAGIPVAPKVAHDYGLKQGTLTGHARRHFLLNGAVPRVGDKLHARGQAEVLRRIARDGRAAFYEGEVAEDMVAALREVGGVHTLDDFAAAACDYPQPVSGAYKHADLVEHPPNGQGATAILMLNILSHFDRDGLDPNGAERVHLETEAAKLAYDARNRFIADPTVHDAGDYLTDPATAARLAALIRTDGVIADPARIAEAVHRDTVYITVVDKDRMAVSLIYSIFHGFGSGIASDKFGILFQNRGAGFSLVDGHPNEMAPGKRPMHTIIPGMLRENGRVSMPFGVMGGQYQPAGHVRVVTNMLDYGMDPQEAIDAPRSFPEDGTLQLENGYSDAVMAALADKGHKVARASGPLGGGQAIRIADSGVLIGGSDPRKDGCAIGY
jgi:gamma-glutamyltranspeptidase/glutathione hydrolase